MANGCSPSVLLDIREAQVATRILGLEAVTSDIRLPEDSYLHSTRSKAV